MHPNAKISIGELYVVEDKINSGALYLLNIILYNV